MALDCSHRQSAFLLGPRLGNRRQTHSGAKRPVLLQTHPGILAVSQRTHDWCSKDRIDEADGQTELQPHGLPDCHLAPSGPRPNALPLHNVRYRKAMTPAGQSLPTPPPRRQRPRLIAARSAPQGNETDQNLIGGSGSWPRRLSFWARTRKLQFCWQRLVLPAMLADDACRRCLPPLMPKHWWSQTGSNRRPHACKARALPTELWPRQRSG